MQDWAWEVADPMRIDEFLFAYESNQLTDDERFTLMETLIQSFEESGRSLLDDPRWGRVLELLVKNIALHIYSVWYWSDLENDNADDAWRVTPFLRKTLELHKHRFDTGQFLCPNTTNLQAKVLAQAVFEIRVLLAGYLGTASTVDMSIRQAAHLAYALHNEALAVLADDEFDPKAAIKRVGAVGGLLGATFTERFEQLLTPNDPSATTEEGRT